MSALVATAASADAAPRVFTLDPGASGIVVHVGRAGLFGFMGHDHRVEAPLGEGRVVADPEDLAASSLTLSFRAAALEVTDPDGPKRDIPEVQAKMEGPDVLDVPRFGTILFASRAVEGREVRPGEWELRIRGDLELHGRTREVELPARVRIAGGTLQAEGELKLKQRDFGIAPVSIAGVVKVKDEVRIAFRAEGRAEPDPSP